MSSAAAGLVGSVVLCDMQTPLLARAALSVRTC